MGFLKASRLFPDGSGKSPFLVTEEFTLEECGWIGRTISHDKGLVFTKALVMDGMRYQFFAGTAFALNKNRGVCRSNILDEFVDRLNIRVFADDSAIFRYAFYPALQITHLFLLQCGALYCSGGLVQN